MIGKFNSLECLEQGCGLIPNVAPDAFAVAPVFDCTEELRVEIDDTDETRPVRYTSDVRYGPVSGKIGLPCLVLHSKYKDIADIEIGDNGDYKWIKTRHILCM